MARAIDAFVDGQGLAQPGQAVRFVAALAGVLPDLVQLVGHRMVLIAIDAAREFEIALEQQVGLLEVPGFVFAKGEVVADPEQQRRRGIGACLCQAQRFPIGSRRFFVTHLEVSYRAEAVEGAGKFGAVRGDDAKQGNASFLPIGCLFVAAGQFFDPAKPRVGICAQQVVAAAALVELGERALREFPGTLEVVAFAFRLGQVQARQYFARIARGVQLLCLGESRFVDVGRGAGLAERCVQVSHHAEQFDARIRIPAEPALHALCSGIDQFARGQRPFAAAIRVGLLEQVE